MKFEDMDFIMDRVALGLEISVTDIAEASSNPKDFFRIEGWILSQGYQKKFEGLRTRYVKKSRIFRFLKRGE